MGLIMPTPPHILKLREKIGHDLLLVPTVGVLIFDEQRRVLLVCHADRKVWTTPGGILEPGETPALAAVREVREETGLIVELVQILGVFGGTEFAITYSNGDEIAYVATYFEGKIISGTPTPDNEETLQVRWFARNDTDAVPFSRQLKIVLDAILDAERTPYFAPAPGESASC